jgi:hypothetical protein
VQVNLDRELVFYYTTSMSEAAVKKHLRTVPGLAKLSIRRALKKNSFRLRGI